MNFKIVQIFREMAAIRLLNVYDYRDTLDDIITEARKDYTLAGSKR